MRTLLAEDVGAFVRDELLAPARARPVVVISTIPHAARTWVEPEELAAALGDAAEVVVIETGDPTWELARHLPPRLAVYGGALRIWWPGLTVDADPYAHELLFVRSEHEAADVARRIVEAIRPGARIPKKDDARSPWARIAAELAPGDVVEGRIQNVKDFGAFVDLPQGVTGLIHKSEIDWTYVVDPRDFVQVGETVRVKVLALDVEQRRIELSLKQTLAESPRVGRAAPRAALPGGSAEVAELGERLERASQELAAADAARADLFEQVKELRAQLTETKRELRSERDSRAALERRVASELDPLSSERAFLRAVRLCHARLLDESERFEHPLVRMRVGKRFLESARELEGLDLDKLVEVCSQVACGIVQEIPAREVHPLRAAGSSSRRRAHDGALAWRCSLQDNTPSARRLHYWNVPGPDGGAIEFALACVHDVYDIPE
jgi:predicted RNA-binding protein with RPS1 domain